PTQASAAILRIQESVAAVADLAPHPNQRWDIREPDNGQAEWIAIGARALAQTVAQLLIDILFNRTPVQVVATTVTWPAKLKNMDRSFGPQPFGQHRIREIPGPNDVLRREMAAQHDQTGSALGFSPPCRKSDPLHVIPVLARQVLQRIPIRVYIDFFVTRRAQQHQVARVCRKALGSVFVVAQRRARALRTG